MKAKLIAQILSALLGVAFIGFAGYGSYRWYFNRPPQSVVNNTYEYKNYTMSGENATVIDTPAEKPKDRRLATGIWAGKDAQGVIITWLW